MLQSFKDRIRGSRWLGYAIVAIISVPFALWGVDAYMRGGSSTAVAEVNGEEIPASVVERRVAQQRQALSQRFGGQLPDAFSDRMLREQVINRLIRTTVLEQAATEAGLKATPEAIAEQVRGTPAFQRDGTFDRELYRRLLERSGMTPAQYETRVRQSVRVRQFERGITATAFVLSSQARKVARLAGQERRVTSLQFPRDAARQAVEVGEAAIEQYYADNRQQFRAPEQVRLAYVELDLEALRQQVEVSEEELRREYEAAGQRYREAAARKASHILIEVPEDAGEGAVARARERARALRQRIMEPGGASFAELARKHSDDSGSARQGGDLGFVTRGMMAKPFEKALFGLPEPGAVSEPVRTRYGFHLIRLEAIREREQKPFSEVRDRIAKDLRTRRAKNRFYERVEVLKNTAYENPEGLRAAAEALGIKVQKSGWISRASGQGIGSHKAVREAAFSQQVLAQRRNSGVIELGERRVAVIRVIDHREPQPRPLAAVRDRVRDKLVAQRVEKRLQAWSDRAIERLRGGAAPSALAEKPVRLERHGWISETAREVDRAVARTAFDQPAPAGDAAAYAATELAQGGRAVVIVHAVRLPDVSSEQVAQTRQRLRRQLAQAEFRAWVSALRDAADIERFDRSDAATEGGGGGQT